jgi:AraC-like DNA-binding protein
VSDEAIERLLNLLEVRVDALAICDIEATAALQCDPMDKVMVHFVLSGTGLLHCENRKHLLRVGTVIIVPRGLQKLIAGEGPIETIHDGKQHCPMEDGLMQYKVGSDGAGPEAGLVLGCAGLEASLDGVSDLFHHLWEPMIEDAIGPAIEPLLVLTERELANPRVGTRAVVSALMKQILIEVFRGQLARESYRSWLWPAMMNPQLARAALAIMSKPESAHTVETLAATAGMSRSRFSEMFGQAFGRSPIEFVQIVRLRTARRLLSSSSLPVKSVAAAVGYSSRSHFSRAYRAYYGEAPSMFRTQNSSVEPVASS